MANHSTSRAAHSEELAQAVREVGVVGVALGQLEQERVQHPCHRTTALPPPLVFLFNLRTARRWASVSLITLSGWEDGGLAFVFRWLRIPGGKEVVQQNRDADLEAHPDLQPSNARARALPATPPRPLSRALLLLSKC